MLNDHVENKAENEQTGKEFFFPHQRVDSLKGQIKGLVAMGVCAIMAEPQHTSQAFTLACVSVCACVPDREDMQRLCSSLGQLLDGG